MSTGAIRETAASYSPPAPPAPGTTKQRIASLDIVRGVVVMLMAIDHVRVYSGLPAGGPTPGNFLLADGPTPVNIPHRGMVSRG